MTRSPVFRLVRDELGRSRRSVLIAIASTVGVALADLARPWPLKVIVDHVLLDNPPSGVVASTLTALPDKATAAVVWASLIVVIAAVTGAFAYLQVRTTSRLGHLVVHRLRRELFGHLQRLSLTVHHRARSGDLLTRLATDTKALRDTFTESAITLGAQAITIVGCLVVMFALSWQLSLVVLATVPLLFWNLFRLSTRSRTAAKANRATEEGVTTQITQALGSAALIQAFGRERYESERFAARTGEHLEDSLKFSRIEAVSARSVELLGAMATALIVMFGALEVLAGRMTPGTVLVFSTYLHSLYRPVRQIAKLTTKMSAAVVSVARLDEVLSMAPEIVDRPDAIEATNIRGEIEFDGVSFGYPGGDPILANVTFRVRPGQRVALVGASGAGKSTIVGLTLRLYDPTAGAIRIDGVDIREFRRESLRRSVSVVLQDALLAGATIRENIGYGKLDATDEEIIRASHHAGAHSFVERLPRGYDTTIGERGATLSGGQRQRLAIARAIVRDAPILLCDEPMTGLDRLSQARVERALARVTRGRTCLIVTHDPQTAATADVVIVLHAGRIVETGPHATLVQQSAIYRELFHLDAPAGQLAEAM